MMKSLNRAAKANMDGSSLLELGETSKALKSFRSALKQLNDGCLSSSVSSASASSSTSEASTSITAVTSRPVQLGANHQELADITPETPARFYSQAFVFVAPSSEDDVSLMQHSFFSAILIYNTALALHQKGSNGDARKAFIKALLFYNESMNLLRPIANQPEAFRVIQEIMRNQADIYYRLNDLGNVQRVWEDLAALTQIQGAIIHQNSQIAASA